jgi:hypothetical protein
MLLGRPGNHATEVRQPPRDGHRQAGPVLFAELIEIGSRDALFAGYVLAAVAMCGAGLAAAWLGVDAERKALEEIARPLSAD